MFQEYNPNPCRRSLGDCTVRAVAKALDVDWETAYLTLAVNAFSMCDMPSSNLVWGATLRENGFKRKMLDGYTFGSFTEEHTDGTYVLCSGTHVATEISGTLYDAWDSSNETPIFVWYRKD